MALNRVFFGLSCLGISNKLTCKTKKSENCNFCLIYWAYRVILALYCDFCEFPRNKLSDKNGKHRNMRFKPVYRVYCAIFAFILRFSEFSRKQLSYETRKHWKLHFNPVYRAYCVVYGLILRFSDFLCFGVWIRCSSRCKIYFCRARNKVLSNPWQPQNLKRAHRKVICRKNVFDGTYRVIWDDYTMRFRMAIQAWKMLWF